MKKIKCVAAIMAGFLIFCGMVAVLNYLYLPENDSQTEHALWNDFYASRGKISHLYLGSSHVYCDINPFLLDERNGQYNFDMATPGQLMNGTYYLLKEADRNNELSHVYIEVYFWFNTKENFNHNEDPSNTYAYKNWKILDYMESSWNKLAYFVRTTQVEKYPDVLFRFVRYRSRIEDWEYVENNVLQKSNRNSQCETEKVMRGYSPSDEIYQEQMRLYEQDRILEEQPMTKSSEKYLRKAISYCQRREIPVTLFISPAYELLLISTEDYDNYVEQIREIAEEYQVDFYDFNLAKGEYLPIQQTKYFLDVGHLNTEGADVFTDFFWQVVSGNASHNQKYFYESYEQKLQSQEPAVYGIYYRASEDSVRNMWLASNRGTEMEYRIICRPDGKEQYTVQDFHINKEFRIDEEEHGICEITYRIKNMSGAEQTIEIEY